MPKDLKCSRCCASIPAFRSACSGRWNWFAFRNALTGLVYCLMCGTEPERNDKR